MPRLRGTVSGCLSHTRVFHRGREHAKLLTIANGRRRSKAVTEPADVSETTVGGGMGSTTRENWANPLAVPSTADPGRPLSPLLSFVSHIFDSASDRLCRRLRSVRRLHDVDFENASCRFTHLIESRESLTVASRVSAYILPPSSERLSIAISQKRLGEHLVLRPESCSVTKFGSRTVSLRLCDQKTGPAGPDP